MAVSVGHATIIPGEATSSALVPGVPPQQSDQPLQSKEAQSQSSHDGENHIQQEVLVGGHLVYGRAQVVGTVVTEDVADPVDGPGHRVAWLVFVNVGEKTCLLAVPVWRETGVGNRDKDTSLYGQLVRDV